MTTDDDGKVKPIGIAYKAPPKDDGEGTLRLVRFGGGCDHTYHFDGGRMTEAHYRIREGETEVECGLCGAKLEPMWVLKRLADKESARQRARHNYQEEMRRLKERQRCKCQHCGQMTRIRR